MNGDSSEHYGVVVLVTLTSSHPNGVVFHLVPRGRGFAGYYEVPKWYCRTRNTCCDKARVITKASLGRLSAAAPRPVLRALESAPRSTVGVTPTRPYRHSQPSCANAYSGAGANGR